MPQIPIYDSPQVKAQQAPNAQLNIQAPNLGAAIGHGLQQVADIAEKARLEADKDVVQKAMNKLTEFRNGWDEHAQTLTWDQLQNPEYTGGEKGQAYADARHQSTVDQIAALASSMSENQKRMFDQHALPAAEADRHRSTLLEYELGQKNRVQQLDEAINLAGAGAEGAVEKNGNFGWDKFEESRFSAEQAARRRAEILKLNPEEEARKATALMAHRAANALLMRSNSGDVQRLVESYGEIMAPEVRDQLLSRSKGINDNKTALAAANEAIRKWTDEAGQQVKIGDAEADLEAKFAEQPEVLKIAKQELHAKAQVKKHDWGQMNDKVAGDILLHLGKGDQSLAVIRQNILATDLPKTQQEKMIEHAEGFFRGKEAHARQMNALAKADLRDKQELALGALYLNRDAVLALTNEQMLGLSSTIGAHNLDRLIQYRQHLMDAAGTVRHMDEKAINQYAFELGWLDPKGKVKPGKAEDYNNAKEAIVQGVITRQNELKRPLTAEETSAEVRKVMTPTRAQVAAPWWAKWGSLGTISAWENTGPAYQFTTLERNRAISAEERFKFTQYLVTEEKRDPLAVAQMMTSNPVMFTQLFAEWERKKKLEAKRVR